MKVYRDVGGHNGLGDRRYERYCAAFDRIEHCIGAGYCLEAIAILDSLLWDRLSSRLGYLKGEPIDVKKNIGTLCSELIGDSGTGGREKDPAFRDTIGDVKGWLFRRNEAVHATAKVFREETSEKDFNDILNSHRQTAADGIKSLRTFDLLDTKSRDEVGKVPASFPDAFFPERRAGQSRSSPWRSDLWSTSSNDV